MRDNVPCSIKLSLYAQFKLILVIISFGAINPAFSQQVVFDYDGNTYTIGDYGDQSWTLQNYRCTSYADGTPIPEFNGTQIEWTALTTGAYTHVNNDSTNDEIYGLLYNGYAVKGVHDNDASTPNKVFAPEGYQIPSAEQYVSLGAWLADNGFNFTSSVNAYTSAAALAAGEWNSSNVNGSPGKSLDTNGMALNTSGFGWYATGWRDNIGFELMGKRGIHWTRTAADWDASEDWSYTIGFNWESSKVFLNWWTNNVGFPVRLVQDKICEEYNNGSVFNESVRYASAIDCWTNIDADGDGRSWGAGRGQAGIFGTDVSFVSSSFWGTSSTSGTILYPDNWLISPAIDLSSYLPSDSLTLEYNVTGRTTDWSQEHYSVYLAQGELISDFEEVGSLFTETLPEAGPGSGSVFKKIKLDVSDFAGLSGVHLAFRHHDSFDQHEIHINGISLEPKYPLNSPEIISRNTLIFPNPSNGVFHLSDFEKGTYNLRNVSGKLVGRGSTEALLDFSKLSTGVYFLELNGNDGSNQHHKIILN